MRKKLIVAAALAPLQVLAVAAQEQAAQGAPAMEITWLGKIETGEQTTWATQQLNERFNVNIVFNNVGLWDAEQHGIMLAAGEFPDVSHAIQDVEILYREDLIRGIPVEMIREYAPNYTRRLDQEFPTAWLASRVPGNENERLGLLQIRTHANTTFSYPAFRSDWAAKVGLTCLATRRSASLSVRSTGCFSTIRTTH